MDKLANLVRGLAFIAVFFVCFGMWSCANMAFGDQGVPQGKCYSDMDVYQSNQETAKVVSDYIAGMMVTHCGDKSNPAGSDILINYNGKTYVLTCSVAVVQEM